MDPLESVTTIYHRRLGGRDSADANLLGGTICLWHDRNISKEDDLLIMNPVYPAMITFAEKSWQGGGYASWVTNTIDAKDFGAFEKRLLDHQRKDFQDKPFPYWKQSDITWKLYGPYDNGGDLRMKFQPENDLSHLVPASEVMGGTVVLRHFWHPLVKGVIADPKENSTWYATRSYWSDADTVCGFRIGFNNFSRSYFTDAPAVGTWNNQLAKIFVNGEELLPPNWNRAGMKGDSEQPLVDEGYEYRKPTMVRLKKGWNNILVKLPVGSFKGKDFNNPVKWMFTVVM